MPFVAAAYRVFADPFATGTPKTLGITDGGVEFEEAPVGRDIAGFGGGTILDTLYRGKNVFVNFTATEFDLDVVQALLHMFTRTGTSPNFVYHAGHEGIIGRSNSAIAIPLTLEHVQAEVPEAPNVPPLMIVHQAVLAADSPLRYALQEDLISLPFRFVAQPVCDSAIFADGPGGRRHYTWYNKDPLTTPNPNTPISDEWQIPGDATPAGPALGFPTNACV